MLLNEINMIISKLPLIGKYITRINNRFTALSNQMCDLAQENIRLRFKLKALSNEKINVVFVCWRPAVWGSLKTVYEAMKSDDAFDVKIITIPNKKQLPKLGLNHDNYESEGAESFWKGDDVIAGYNYETKDWFDLQLLKADYVCFQQPYNVCRTVAEKSWVVNKYAKIFYVAYYAFIDCKEDDFINRDTTPLDFMKDVSLYFAQNEAEKKFISNRMKEADNISCKVIKTGFPCYDNLIKDYDIKESSWTKKNEDRFKLIWTPRWCTNENNCHFFTYKQELVNYCNDKSDIDFVFRPHPQMFLNFASTGELSEKEANDYKRIFADSDNMTIDVSKDYHPTFYTASCMITDISSVVPEFFLTGKPIIYCHRKGSFNSFSKDKGYSSGFYWVENWNELKDTLDMLRSGNDPLKEKRQELINSNFFIPKEGAGFLIKEAIKQDFLNA